MEAVSFSGKENGGVRGRRKLPILRGGIRKNHADALELEAILTGDDEDYDELDLHDEELLRFTTDLFHDTLSRRSRRMSFLLGLFALLDFMSFLAPVLLRHPGNEAAESTKQYEDNVPPKYVYMYQRFLEDVADRFDEEHLRSILVWLEVHSDAIGITFSLLWFVHAFGRANRVRFWVLRRRDRKKLLNQDTTRKEEVEENPAITDWTGGAWGVYAIMVSIQLLLLPIGFYATSYHAFCAFFHGVSGIVDAPAHPTKEMAELNMVDDVVSKKFGQSLLYVVLHQAAEIAAHILKSKVMTKIGEHVSRLKHFLAKFLAKLAVPFALRHPLEFKRRVVKIFRVLSWTRYIYPLIVGLNKLKVSKRDIANASYGVHIFTPQSMFLCLPSL